MEHTPNPFFGQGGNPTIGGGVACSCGTTFTIGDSAPDTPLGIPSKRKLKTMRACWQAFPGMKTNDLERG